MSALKRGTWKNNRRYHCIAVCFFYVRIHMRQTTDVNLKQNMAPGREAPDAPFFYLEDDTNVPDD